MAARSSRVFPRLQPFLTARKAMLGYALSRLQVRRGLFIALTLITVLLGPNGLVTNLPVVHANPQSSLASGGHPNRFDPSQDTHSVTRKRPTGQSDPNWKPHAPQSLTHPLPPSMQPGVLVLTPGKAAQFLGSDGRLEVDIPATALTPADFTQAGGTLTLEITQIAPASGSSAGGSGLISFGTYLLQLVDVQGKRVPHGFRVPITLKFHYGAEEGALDLTHAFVVFNASLPKGTKMAPSAVANAPDLGTLTTQSATLDPATRSLSVSPLVGSPGTSVSWDTDAPVADFGAPDPFTVDLNAGALTMSLPIDLPPGPGGFTPPVSLSYSSAAVSEQHGGQGAASWVGEGWNLTLGSISWSEQDVTAGCNCSANWENKWSLNDPFGTSAELIPPNINISTFYDDTGNSLTPSPIFWQTAPAMHAKVISYTGPITLGGLAAPCFRVFLTNGIMEEFGCTSDSLEYYLEPSGTNQGKPYISSWLLDLITDRHGNQIHLTYQWDRETGTGGQIYPRAAELATIEYDSPSCQDAQNACAGAAWAPLMRVNFMATHTPTRLTNIPTGCNIASNTRCDDPLDLSSSSGLAAPTVQSTFVLNDIQVQVRSSGTGTWNTLHDYQLGYEQSGPTTNADPATGKQESMAGMLDLTTFQEIGDDGTTALPLRSFSYSTLTEHYEDDAFHPNPSTNCGPTWNSSACLLWSQSSASNSRYLSTADNGMGLHQVFSWAEARNNTHGVNGGGSNTADPLYCDGKEAQGYPCSQADDQNWSHAVLTQETDSVLRTSQQGQGGQRSSISVDSTTTYSYQLTYPLLAQPCSDCVAGMYWGNQNDADFLDYYNNKFMGFAQATVTHPDGSVEIHHYYTTEGWGIYDTSQVTCYASNPCHNDPWWDLPNVAHGHETEVDTYDTDGTTLLKQTYTQYQALCPPSGVGGTPAWSGWGNWNGNLVSALDHNNPVASCDVQTTQTDEYTYDGSITASTPGFTASQGFSATQGQNQWRYQYSADGEQTLTDMSYDSSNTRWYGPQSTCFVGANWQHPASSGCDSVRTWVAPGAGTAILAANGPITVATGCSSMSPGLQIRILKNGTQIWPTSGWKWLNHGDVFPFPTLTTPVVAGDQIQFVLAPLPGNNACDTTTWDVRVTLGIGGVLHTATSFTYDSYGRVITAQTLSDAGGSPGSPMSTTIHTAYVWNDAVTATATSATGTYLINFPAYNYTLDGNGNQVSCSYTSYDGLTDEVGAQSNFTGAGNVTATAQYTGLSTSTCGYQASRGFSAVQGQNQWRYQYSTDGENTIQDLPTYDSLNARWQAPGSDRYCLIWANGQAPDGVFFGPPTCDSIRTWVAPSAGTVTLSANGPITVAGPCGNIDGVKIRVLKNGTQLWPASGWQSIGTAESLTFPPQITSVAAGDHLQFVLNENGWPDCDSTTWDPQVDYGAAGTGTIPAVYQTTTPNTVFQASTGFGATQGQNQWSYQYSTDIETTFSPMTYDSTNQRWQGSATYCLTWANGQSPTKGGNGIGPGCDSIRTWTAPSGGEVMITANGLLSLAPQCNGNPNGVTIRILKNGSPFWPSASVWQTINHGSTFAFPTLLVNLAAGDQLQFVVAHIGALDDCDSLTWDPRLTTLNSWVETTTSTYDSYGNLLTTTDADANAGDATHKGCTLGGTTYSTCRAYDTTFQVLPTSVTNALNQTASAGYTQTAVGGFGLWPTATTDPNGQTTTTSYDALGRMISQILPGETSGLTTTSTTYTNFCAATGAQAPCLEVDQTLRLDATPTDTITSRAFYDGFGHLVETRTPGANGQDVVQYTYYDPSGQVVFTSNPYYVTPYTGSAGPSAYSLPDSTQVGSSATYPNLRTSTVQDALSNAATATSAVVCNAAGINDSACYLQSSAVDALGHQARTLTDALGREIYDQRYTGNSSATYAVSATTTYTYGALGNLAQILHPDGVTTTSFLADAAGHQLRIIDPDRGTEFYFYDANGNPVQTMDARGSAGTAYAGYDALNRQLWRNTTNSPAGAYVTYTYDGTVPTGVSCSGITPGSNALGFLTTEQFKSGPGNSFSGAYCYGYDARGEPIGEVDTLAGTTYLPILYTYNDAGMPLKLTYPTTEYALNNYSSQGWLTSITRSARGTTNFLVPSITYNGASGAAGLPDSYVVGGSGNCSSANSSIICISFGYDGDLRPTQATFTHPTSSTPITDYSLGVTYDAVSHITSLGSGLPAAGGQSGGQDNQQFCYDEQDRLTWAGNSGTNPCTGQAVTGTTLPTGSAYTASYQYDVMGRLAQSTLTGALAGNPQGTYTYDSQHVHAADVISSGGYTAQYDAAGNMTCRAPTGTQVCTTGSQTGAQLTYDVEGRLIQWVSSDGLTTVKYGYDGEGHRFEMQVTSSSTTTTTTYIGDLEEVQAVSGGATTKIVYFYWGGQRIAEDDNTHWYYPITDQLTSTTVMVDYSGVTAAQVFGPYGQGRWGGGTMPTSFAFTGQRSDSATGLNYYGARYYDPQAGQFTSADTILPGGGADPWGLSRYAYVEGNPTNSVDPSGHDPCSGFWSCLWYGVKQVYHAVKAAVGCLASSGYQACGNQVVQTAESNCMSDPEACAQGITTAVTGIQSNLQAIGKGVAELSGVSSIRRDFSTLTDKHASFGDQVLALGDLAINVGIDLSFLDGDGEAARASDLGLGAVDEGGDRVFDEGAITGGGGCGLSFSADTQVATPTGEQAISSLKVGDQIQAYDPQTGQVSTQTVQHVWINHDTDLLNVTLQVNDTTNQATQAQTASTLPQGPRSPNDTYGKPTDQAGISGSTPPGFQTSKTHEETIHTTANHPWLTADRGWVLAGNLRIGEPVLRGDGTTAVVALVQVVPGAGTMYDLEVSHIHTFEVGVGRWVVHNSEGCGGGGTPDFRAPSNDDVLSNGQRYDDFRDSATNCFYCGNELRTGGGRGIASRNPIVEHVYPRARAENSGVFQTQAEWDRFITYEPGLVVSCRSCNGIKGTKPIGSFRPIGGGRPGWETEAQQKWDASKQEFGLP